MVVSGPTALPFHHDLETLAIARDLDTRHPMPPGFVRSCFLCGGASVLLYHSFQGEDLGCRVKTVLDRAFPEGLDRR